MEKHVLLVCSKLCAISHVLQTFLEKFAVFCSTLYGYLNSMKLYTMLFFCFFHPLSCVFVVADYLENSNIEYEKLQN